MCHNEMQITLYLLPRNPGMNIFIHLSYFKIALYTGPSLWWGHPICQEIVATLERWHEREK